MSQVNVSTIGFTQISAEDFFDRLEKAHIRKVIDVRLRNTSQLSGFAKAKDLKYFLDRIGHIEYVHEPLLAPTDEMLTAYKKHGGDWPAYEQKFLKLMSERQIERAVKRESFQDACLLCSEAEPHHCHRRLVCDYLNDKWSGALRVKHL
ncbi:MAG: DUF488 domain-containing protein [Alphaproteobacteria bacterium]